MANKKVYLVALTKRGHRPSEPGEIVGVEMAPFSGKELPCFRLRDKDGKEYYTPVNEGGTYTHPFLSEADVDAGRIPEVLLNFGDRVVVIAGNGQGKHGVVTSNYDADPDLSCMIRLDGDTQEYGWTVANLARE